MTSTFMRFSLFSLVSATLLACNKDGGQPVEQACVESGPYACASGGTEPLYPFQWALNYENSYFKAYPDAFSGGLDLNVEPVHKLGIKGQGVNVLVLDSGTDLHHEELTPNADRSLSWNFLTRNNDPMPVTLDNADGPHGTVVAGIIGAAQNGKGVMGIAPAVRLGAANVLESWQTEPNTFFLSYGNAPWSSKAHVFNASYGLDTQSMPYESETDQETSSIRGLKRLRDGKGAIFIKSAGNSFDLGDCTLKAAYYNCTNPANDPASLEPNVIIVAALNARGRASSYSSAGSVLWISGMGGEYASYGVYGEPAGPDEDGPTIFSTDLQGCIHGYSYIGANIPFKRGQSERNGIQDNPNCDYTSMNGTSAAAPTITGVAALMLSANPDLTWRDVRDILRLSARKVDADYHRRQPFNGNKPYGGLLNLSTNQLTAQLGQTADIHDGASVVPMDLGWQRNSAGLDYSNRYGFGVPDTLRAVTLAQAYASAPSLSRGGDVNIPDFAPVAYWHSENVAPDPDLDAAPARIGPFPYQRITSIGTLSSPAQTVDQFQVRLSGINVCLGSLGIAVKSPSGTVSLLKLPEDHFKQQAWDSFEDYGLGSFAFYGEAAQGDWEIFALASNPMLPTVLDDSGNPGNDETEFCTDTPPNFHFYAEARIIGQ